MIVNKIVYLCACATVARAHLETAVERSSVNNGQSFVEKLVIKGWGVPPGKYPFMVRIQTNATEHHCGGVLISHSVVLTAAHCLMAPASRFKVYVHDCEEEKCRHEIKVLTFHEKFDTSLDRDYGPYDVGLVILKKPVSAFYQPIKLAGYDISEHPGLEVSIAGWGFTDSTLNYSKILMESRIKISSKKYCEVHMKNYKSNVPVDVFCADKIDSSNCYADSGGPLFLYDREFVVFGIVAYGDENCTDPNMPGPRTGVYTNVFRFRQWIADHIEKFLGQSIGDKLVIKGWRVPPGKYPFMVRIQTKATEHHCGGFLISHSVVLTAAHCLMAPASRFKVYVHDCEEEKCRHEIKISTVHEKYDTSSELDYGPYDVALVVLKKPVSASYQPIKLADYDISEHPGLEVSVAGWGFTDETLDNSKFLMESRIKISSKKHCEEYHMKSYKSNVPVNVFCADKIDSSNCYGDSGGPLFLYDREFVVFGIVAYGDENCTDPNMPGPRTGVYTNVFRFRQWIADHIEKFLGIQPLIATTKRPTFGFSGVHIF